MSNPGELARPPPQGWSEKNWLVNQAAHRKPTSNHHICSHCGRSPWSPLPIEYTFLAFTTMQKLFDCLARIEKQNLEILAAVAPKASRKYLSVEEAAERLDRSAWTIRQLCKSGQIKAVKGNDGCWRIPADEVARLEEEGVPTLPKRLNRTDAASPLALPRGRDAGIAALCDPSYAQAT